MNSKKIIIGATIGISAAILWSAVFINVLNSMAGIGIGICLGISFGTSGSLIFSKKEELCTILWVFIYEKKRSRSNKYY